jgi:hypothetical protein
MEDGGIFRSKCLASSNSSNIESDEDFFWGGDLNSLMFNKY